MSEFIPNSSVGFICGYPCSNNYEHTIHFSSIEQQTRYFEDIVKFWAGTSSLSGGNYSYQRVNKNTINVGCKIEDVIYCNYMMFKNFEFENKWFYAFITSIDYVNNNVTAITYEIDVIQTYMFFFQFQDCFVEREHSASDNIGDNIVPEQLEIGDYIFEDQGTVWQNNHTTSDFSVCIAAPWERLQVTDTWEVPVDAEPGFYNGVYSGLHYTTFPLGVSNEELEQTLNDFMGDIDQAFWEHRKEEIVSIFMIPSDIVTDKSRFPLSSSAGKYINVSPVTSWKNYTPKNKKLFTFPYNCIYVTSSDGDSSYYKYELFPENPSNHNRICSFVVEGVMGVPPEISLSPFIYDYDISDSDYIKYLITGTITQNAGPMTPRLSLYSDNITPETFNEKYFIGKKITVGGNLRFFTILDAYFDGTNTIVGLDRTLPSDVEAGAAFVILSGINYNFSLRLHNFPMCSWVTEPFMQWLAENTTSLLARGGLAVGAGVAAGAVAAAFPGTAVGDFAFNAVSGMAQGAGEGLGNSIGKIGDLIKETTKAMLQPDQANGSCRGALPIANGEFGYHFYNAHIRPEMAKIIDDYFTMYGYAVREVKEPNVNSRQYWNYIKTIGCNVIPLVISGTPPYNKFGLNSEDARKINSIFDNGITLWHAHTIGSGAVSVSVCNYHRDNPIVEVE